MSDVPPFFSISSFQKMISENMFNASWLALTYTLSFPLLFYMQCSLLSPRLLCNQQRPPWERGDEQTLSSSLSLSVLLLSPPWLHILSLVLLRSSPASLPFWLHLFQSISLCFLFLVTGLSMQLQRSRYPLSLLKQTTPAPTPLPAPYRTSYSSIHLIHSIIQSFKKYLLNVYLYICVYNMHHRRPWESSNIQGFCSHSWCLDWGRTTQ